MELLVGQQASAICDMQFLAFFITLKWFGKQNMWFYTR